MSDQTLRAAFIAGGMYDHLYRSLVSFEKTTGVEVKVAYQGLHPELNAHLASLGDVQYDVVSTHTKYAPSQTSFLAPLDDIADEFDTAGFYRPLIELATIDGHLYGIPRNIDVKLLHYRADLVNDPPRNWNGLVEIARRLSDGAGAYGFVFTGMESGLFGIFYELAEMGGASLFPESNLPRLNNEGGTWALEILREMYSSGAVPAEIVNWHYDEVHRCFRDGHAAMVCDWPGYYGAYRHGADSKIRDTFKVARMPAGPSGMHRAYSGSHTFALTRRGASRASAVELLRFLTSPEQQLLEARQGAVPTRPGVLAQVRAEAEPPEAERWRLLDLVVANDMLIPPRLSYYPEIEEILWRTVRSAMTSEIGIGAALETMERRIAETHTHAS
jgi:multiple sugar transport system substrate-binding protein